MKRYFREIVIQTLVWSFTILFYNVLRQYGQELVNEPESKSLLEHIITIISTGLLFSITLVSFEKLLINRLVLFKSFGLTILVRSLLYLVIFMFLIVIGTIIFMLSSNDTPRVNNIFSYLLSPEGVLTLSYLFIVSFLIQFIKQADKKFGPGNLSRMLKGQFHSPKEVERIVMFLDLKSSTTIAEKIGHVKYSRLIQDCFKELTIDSMFGAEIYQYVGDEVVLVWEPSNGLKNDNFIKFYYTFRQSLLYKTEYFNSNYNVVPNFKCGCHIGKVVMTEIGQIKSEIAYHGDVMNTAARIQSQCNTYNKEFLISEKLHKLLSNLTFVKFDFIGSVNLKGKVKDVKIYSVEINKG